MHLVGNETLPTYPCGTILQPITRSTIFKKLIHDIFREMHICTRTTEHATERTLVLLSIAL